MRKKKILIIRFSSLGDVILVHPAIRKLYDNGYEVDLLIKEQYKKIFTYNPYINNILLLENYRNLFQILRKIEKNNYYRILDLHNNLRTGFIKLFFFYKIITYKKYRFRRFLLLHFNINFLKNNSVTKNYVKSLQNLGLNITKKDTEYRIFFKETKNAKRLLKKNMIVIAPFAKHLTKEWVYYEELIKNLNRKNNIIIIGEAEEYSRAKKFNQKNVFNLCGKLDLNEIVYIINKSKLLITNDSGIMHLGAGTETLIVSIFGSTVKEFGFIPLRKNVIIVENNSLECRPCDYHGKDSCPKKHFKCMRDISNEKVLNNVRKFIKI